MLARRLISIPAIAIAWCLWLALIGPALVLSALLDVVGRRRSWARCRALLAVGWLLSCELAGLLGAWALWMHRLLHRDRARFVAANAGLQRWWTATVFAGARRLYGLRLDLAGLDVAADGGFVLLVRHCSVLDTVLAAVFVAGPHRRLLRYVLKRELLWDPCLDVVGNRLPNVFVARAPARRDADLAAITALAAAMPPEQGLLIYPEGSRATPTKRARAMAQLEASGSPAVLERARALAHVMPPRPGGVLAILAARPDLDVIVMGHTGLEGATRVSDLWRGSLIGATIRISLRRYPAASVPAAPEARLLWLFDRWLELDAWVGQVTPGTVGGGNPPAPGPS